MGSFVDVVEKSSLAKSVDPFGKGVLPQVLHIVELEEATLTLKGIDESTISFDEGTMHSTILWDMLTMDPCVKGEHVIKLQPKVVQNPKNMIENRDRVLQFTGKLPIIKNISMAIDHGSHYYVVYKIFYVGQALYEVFFYLAKL